MKATATETPSTYSHLDDLQAGSSDTPDQLTGTFSGKGISNHRPDTVTTVSEAQRIEDAFWEKKPLQERQITSSDVLTAYGNDEMSLRSGLFLEKLCLKKIPHDDIRVAPYNVVQEFNRVPDQNNECQSAIVAFKEKLAEEFVKAEAHFTMECEQRGIVRDRWQFTTDDVKAIIDALCQHNPADPMPLARFKSNELLSLRWELSQPLIPDEVTLDFLAAMVIHGLKYPEAEYHLTVPSADDRQVTPDIVTQCYQIAKVIHDEMERLKMECRLQGYQIAKVIHEELGRTKMEYRLTTDQPSNDQ